MVNIMGIVNTTPDSFWAESRVQGDQAVLYGLSLVAEGADVLDIGGESTRPGAAYVDESTEKARVLPVVEGLRAAGCQQDLSIDTRKRSVMEAAAKAGANWLNDVSALQDDPTLAPFAAEAGLTVVLMHRQGHPDTMQKAPHYENVVDEVRDFLLRRIETAVAAGISPERIIIDPGFGFGKTLDHTLALFRGLPRLMNLGVPVLIGVSRKSFLGTIAGAAVNDRLAASLAGALAAARAGASWIRVHDVAATRQALNVWNALDSRGTA